jgi:hypothetical protein
MMPDIAQERRQLHGLVDRLGPSELQAVRHLLEVMLHPLSRKLARAPVEDEEISAEEERAVAEAKEWLKHNQPIAHEQVLADLGLTTDDFERMAETPLPPKRNG